MNKNKFSKPENNIIIVIEKYNFLGRVLKGSDTFLLLNTLPSGSGDAVQYYTSKRVDYYSKHGVRIATSDDFKRFGVSEIGYINDDEMIYEKHGYEKIFFDIKLSPFNFNNVETSAILKKCYIFKNDEIIYAYHNDIQMCQFHIKDGKFSFHGNFSRDVLDNPSQNITMLHKQDIKDSVIDMKKTLELRLLYVSLYQQKEK